VTTETDEDIANLPIAAKTAKFRQPSASPFGASDQIGMLNLISSSSTAAALAEADGGRAFDLAVDYFVGMPAWVRTGDPTFQIWTTHRPAGTVVDDSMGVGAQNELVGYSGDCISLYSHCGTHIDALNHFGYRGTIWNLFDERRHLGSRNWTVCGPENFPPLIARGVLLDVAALKTVNMLPDSYGIDAADLADAARRQHIEIRPGDVVFVRTGRMQRWPEPAFVDNEPGLNREGAAFLAEAGAMVIGSDNQALEQMPSADPENWQVVHTYLLAEAGVPIIEVANLEELAAEKLYEFVFVGACIRVRGATAAPMRPLVFPIRR
jgi:kynurenine formamidase